MTARLSLTAAGRAAAANSMGAGLGVTLTRLALGSGTGSGDQSARVSLDAQHDIEDVTGAVSGSQIGIRADFTPSQAYAVTEIGLFARVGAGPEFLFAYWIGADADAAAAAATPGADFFIAGVIHVLSSSADITVAPAVDITLQAAPTNVVLASNVDLATNARSVVPLAASMDDFRWLEVIAGADVTAIAGSVRVPCSAVVARRTRAELLGWVLNNSGSRVQLYVVNTADGTLTARGSPQSESTGAQEGAALALVGTDLLGWVVNNTTDRARLYVVNPDDGTLTARGSAQSLGSGNYRGAALALVGADLLGWVLNDSNDRVQLYVVNPTDGALTARGSAQSLGSGTHRAVALALVGTNLLGWVLNDSNDQAQLYVVNTADGTLTARGSPQAVGATATGAALAVVGTDLLGWILAAQKLQLYVVNPTDGTLTARGSLQTLPSGSAFEGAALVEVVDALEVSLASDGIELDRAGASSLGVLTESAMHVHEIVGIR